MRLFKIASLEFCILKDFKSPHQGFFSFKAKFIPIPTIVLFWDPEIPFSTRIPPIFLLLYLYWVPLVLL